MPRPPVRTALVGTPLAVALVLTGCTSAPSRPDGTSLTAVTSADATQAPPVTPAVTAPARAQGSQPAQVAPLTTRRRADVRVLGTQTLPPATRARLAALSRPAGSLVFSAGTTSIGGAAVETVGVDASSFRAFTAAGTAESDPVWQAVANGSAVVSHDAAQRRSLTPGSTLTVASRKGPQVRLQLRLGALATTGLSGADLVLDDEVARRLGVVAGNAMLLTAPQGQDPVAFAAQVRKAAGAGVAVDLLRTNAQVARLTGGRAAQDLGAFSYRYFADGTIEPDADWVRDNIRTETVPVFGRVTCHRLMLPQLRGALQDVVDAGLASSLKTYDGCYVPRFIERDPARSISLHTWGIAIDLDAATNYRGIRGTMDPRIVTIFKRWGFRWGGDWAYTDPMHFELGTLLNEPAG